MGELKDKLMDKCLIEELADTCVLVEYQRLVRYPLSQYTSTILDRKFELLKVRSKFYLDEPKSIEDCRLNS